MQRLRGFSVQRAIQNVRATLQRFLPDVSVRKAATLRPYVGLITFSAAALAIALGITLRQHITFEYHSSAGVVGWLSANAYPKQQEYFFYLLALLGLPLTICLYWLGWCVYSQWCANRTAAPIQRVLKANALASIPLWLCWFQVYRMGQQTVIGLLLPIGLSVLLKWVLLRKRYFPTRWSSEEGSEPDAEIERASDSNGNTPRRKKMWQTGLEYILLPVFIYLLTYAGNPHGSIDLFHEGERLAPLNEMLRGGIPFRDIYVQHGLFQNAYLAWIGSHLFEPTLFGVRTMEDVLDPLGYVALYLLGLQVFRGRFLTAFIAVLISSGVGFWVTARHSLGLLGFAFVASCLTQYPRPFSWRFAFAGLSTSLAFWYSTEIGLYTLGAIGLFLFLYGLRKGTPTRKGFSPLLNYTCGLLLGFLPLSLYFLRHGALDDAIWNSYIQCRYQLATWGLAFPSLSETVTLISTEGWHGFIFSNKFPWYLPICVFLIIAVHLTYRRLTGTDSVRTLKLLLLLLGGVAFFRTALGRSDSGHLIYGATFLWLLCLYPLEGGLVRLFRRLKEKAPRQEVLKAAWVLIPILVFCWYVAEAYQPVTAFRGRWRSLSQNPFKQRIAPEELGRAGAVDIPDDQAAQVTKVVAYIQEHTAETEKIFDFTSQGAYYFFANRPSVTRFHQVSYASTHGMQQEVIEALERDKTRLVIFKTGGWFDAVDGIPVEKRHPLIAAYLQANYEPAININNTEILLRK